VPLVPSELDPVAGLAMMRGGTTCVAVGGRWISVFSVDIRPFAARSPPDVKGPASPAAAAPESPLPPPPPPPPPARSYRRACPAQVRGALVAVGTFAAVADIPATVCVVASAGGQIAAFDHGTERVLSTTASSVLPGGAAPLSLACHPHRDSCAVGCSDGSVVVLSNLLTAPTVAASVRFHASPVVDLAISPCGAFLASASAGGTGAVWSAPSDKPDKVTDWILFYI
jgi:hypothetical protein